MTTVFVLHHVAHVDSGAEDEKLIGVYSTRQHAEAAIQRLRSLPGFSDFPDGFVIDEYALDEDHWTEGFVTLPS
ncbi:MAG: hypothetical protein KC776_37490 [Myxococcales bacterium]|nr:hypothetical protein [Myxococcales bacterium]